MRQQAEEVILAQIKDGTLLPGMRLPPIRAFSAQLGMSFRTVQQALLGLQAKGYVNMRQGAGTFVASTKPELTLGDAVVLCMETQGHVFGQMTGLLTRRLHAQGRMPTMVDTLHPQWQDLVIQAAHSDANVFVIHGGYSFDSSVFHRPLFADKRLIGIIEWEDAALAARMPVALVDFRSGGEQVARHLAEAGHHRTLLVGPENLLSNTTRQAAGFRHAWPGTIAQVVIRYAADDTPALDADAAVALLRDSGAPTTVFGMRDYDVVCLERALAARGIDLAASCERIGFGDTPWSRGDRGFSTVDWNLDAIAAQVCRFISEGAPDGTKPPRALIAPRLVLRQRRVG